MKVFISQPMNGKSENYILARREELIDKVRKWFGGELEFIDSYTKSPEIEAKGSVAMLGHSIMLMADADLVIFSRDWESARGCRIEEQVARSYDIPILIESHDPRIIVHQQYDPKMREIDTSIIFSRLW